MKCWKCGAELLPDAMFCNNCGAKQQTDPAPQDPDLSAREQSAPAPAQAVRGQGQYPGGQQAPVSGAGAGGSNAILTAFAAVCTAVCAWQVLSALFRVVSAVFRIGRIGIFALIRITFLNALTIVSLGLMAVVCAMIAFKRDKQNSDGLLVCLAGSGVLSLAVKLLLTLINIISYSRSSLRYLGQFVLFGLGIVVAVAGIYAIERFVLGETPLMGKSVEDLKADALTAFNSFRQVAGEVGTQASQAAQQAQARTQTQPAPFAQAQPTPFAQTQPAPFAQTQPAQFQAPQPGQVPPPVSGYAAAPVHLKADRSLILYILLTGITCGIYGLYFIHTLARDVNIACDGDGKSTAGLLKVLLLSFITCGIYGIIWFYSLGNRLAENAPRYGLVFQENGTTVLLWQVIGALLCGVGPLVSMHIIIKNTNALCSAYNHRHAI